MTLASPPLRLAALAFALSCSGAVADAEAPPYAPAQADYRIYSRELGEPAPANAADAKVALFVHGSTAKELFDRLGKDRFDACTDGQQIRVRTAPGGRLRCQREADGTYNCTFGIDLKKGTLIHGSIC